VTVAETRFLTADGRAVPAVTSGEMRDVDRVAVEEVGLGLLQMMEMAGRNLAETVREAASGGDSVVLAGDGGNGGGGLACARHLANHGTAVSVVLDRPPERLEKAAATQYGILDAMDVPVAVGAGELAATPSVVVDALVGYGLDGRLRGTAAELVERIPDGSTVVSLDVPTGRNATTGEEPGPAVTPDSVLTLALPKTGLVGLDCRLLLADIAIPAAVYDRLGVDCPGVFDGEYVIDIETR
jgi:NAD(P)H-hydrate epimerase